MSYVVGWVHGVAVLDNIMYVVCDESSTILLYNTDTYSPLDVVINVTGMNNPTDMVVCRDDRQLYFADYNYRIWRVSADDHSDQEKWLPTESTTDTFPVTKLSVTSRRLLVTTMFYPPSLRQYSMTDRQLLRVVQLPGYVMSLYHGVETTRGTFVVGHLGTSQDKEQTAVSELIRFCHILLIAVTIYWSDMPNVLFLDCCELIQLNNYKFSIIIISVNCLLLIISKCDGLYY